MTETVPDCQDAFHDGAEGLEYEIRHGDLTMVGFECPTCGFRTVRTETFVPTEKACPRCGKSFMGIPDEPTETCDACFKMGLDDWLSTQKLDG